MYSPIFDGEKAVAYVAKMSMSKREIPADLEDTEMSEYDIIFIIISCLGMRKSPLRAEHAQKHGVLTYNWDGVELTHKIKAGLEQNSGNVRGTSYCNIWLLA